jgi:hypothetical protein
MNRCSKNINVNILNIVLSFDHDHDQFTKIKIVDNIIMYVQPL